MAGKPGAAPVVEPLQYDPVAKAIAVDLYFDNDGGTIDIDFNDDNHCK